MLCERGLREHVNSNLSSIYFITPYKGTTAVPKSSNQCKVHQLCVEKLGSNCVRIYRVRHDSTVGTSIVLYNIQIFWNRDTLKRKSVCWRIYFRHFRNGLNPCQFYRAFNNCKTYDLHRTNLKGTFTIDQLSLTMTLNCISHVIVPSLLYASFTIPLKYNELKRDDKDESELQACSTNPQRRF